MKNILNVVLVFIASVFIVVLIELVSYKLLNENDKLSLFVDYSVSEGKKLSGLNSVGFDEIDPLTGWSMSDSLLHEKGFATYNKNKLLKTKHKEGKPIIIYLSGGSTTDIATLPNNWPIFLIELLDSMKINSEIHIGAIGGYNSGQEFLKLLNYDFDLHPDIHISYSGANEVEPKYVSMPEQQFFLKKKNANSVFLPNTYRYLNELLTSPKEKEGMTVINHYEKVYEMYYANDFSDLDSLAFTFWRKNMKMMKTVADLNGYNFVGVLQPVLGAGKYKQEIDGEKQNIEEMIHYYQQYYKSFIKLSDTEPHLYNLTNIFDNEKDIVYLDDCHIYDKYQKLVVKEIFNIILKELVFQNDK